MQWNRTSNLAAEIFGIHTQNEYAGRNFFISHVSYLGALTGERRIHPIAVPFCAIANAIILGIASIPISIEYTLIIIPMVIAESILKLPAIVIDGLSKFADNLRDISSSIADKFNQFLENTRPIIENIRDFLSETRDGLSESVRHGMSVVAREFGKLQNFLSRQFSAIRESFNLQEELEHLLGQNTMLSEVFIEQNKTEQVKLNPEESQKRLETVNHSINASGKIISMLNDESVALDERLRNVSTTFALVSGLLETAKSNLKEFLEDSDKIQADRSEENQEMINSLKTSLIKTINLHAEGLEFLDKAAYNGKFSEIKTEYLEKTESHLVDLARELKLIEEKFAERSQNGISLH